jgi:N-acetylneuraminic acid mutarotase
MASKMHGVKKCSSSVEVLSVLRDFRRTKKFCDITLKCGERNFYAHCCILAAVSPFYLAMFRSGMSEVNCEFKTVDLAFLSVSPSAVSVALDYIYGEVIEINVENVFELLVIADYMFLNELKNDVSNYLCECLSVEKPDLCFETRRVAELYGCKGLYEATNSFINAMFYRLSHTSAFLELSVTELESFLESDDLSTNEHERFEGILKWAANSRESRELELGRLLNEYIRPQTLSPRECREMFARYELLPNLFILDMFEERFFRPDNVPNEMHRRGRQGQEAILVFDNDKPQAYIPGLIPWHPIMPMPETREQFKVVMLNNLVYVIGGTTGQTISLTVWRYFPSQNFWKTAAPMLKTAASFGVAALAGRIYATGGPNAKYNMQVYDPLEDEWFFGTPMQVKRVYHCMVTFQNKYLVAIGGNTPTTDSLYSVEKYDRETETWTYMPQLNIGRIEASAIAFDDKIYVVGGYSGSSPPELNSCEVYDSSTNKWSLIEPTITPRRDAAITVYHGKVYVLGGNPKKGLPNFEYYCEETKSWKTEESGSFSSGCQCCTVTLSGKCICELYER